MLEKLNCKQGLKHLILGSLFCGLGMTAFAEGEGGQEGGETGGAQGKPTGENSGRGVDIEVLLAQVRKDEEAKYSPQIETLKAENADLKGKLSKALLDSAGYRSELEKKGNNSEQEAKITALTGEVDRLKKELEKAPKEEDIRARIEKEYEIKEYKKTAMAKNKKKILSPFASEVTGNTKEEIDASIASAIEKSAKIREELGIGEPDDEGEQDNSGAGNGGAGKSSRTGKMPRVNPSFGGSAKTIDLEYLKELDPSSKEYKEFREKFGLK